MFKRRDRQLSLKLLLCDILKMISHNNFKCGSITFHKKKKQLAKYQQLGISLLRNNLTQFYVFTLSIPASVVLVCYYFLVASSFDVLKACSNKTKCMHRVCFNHILLCRVSLHITTFFNSLSKIHVHKKFKWKSFYVIFYQWWLTEWQETVWLIQNAALVFKWNYL